LGVESAERREVKKLDIGVVVAVEGMVGGGAGLGAGR